MKQQFLSGDDFCLLFQFNEDCEDSDAGGHSLSKLELKRLSELGVIQNLGFGKHGVTSFGDWIIETEFSQNTSLPLKTVDEYNRSQAAMKGDAK